MQAAVVQPAKRHPVYYRPIHPCMAVTYLLNLIIISMAYISLVLQSGLRKSKKKTSFEKFWLKHQGWTQSYFCGSTSASASTSSQVDELSTADIGCSDFGENVDVGRLGPPKPESEDTEGETKFPLRRVGRECVRIEDAEQTVQEYILQM